MKEDEFDTEALIDQMAAYLGLPVEDAYRAGIRLHLEVAHAIARDVLAFETADDTEPAPVFSA